MVASLGDTRRVTICRDNQDGGVMGKEDGHGRKFRDMGAVVEAAAVPTHRCCLSRGTRTMMLRLTTALILTALEPGRAAPPPCVLSGMPVALSPDASGGETSAANELALWAGTMLAGHPPSGPIKPLPIVTPAAAAGRPHFAVGVEAALAAGLPAAQLGFAALGEEGFAASCSPSGGGARSYVLSGARNSTTGRGSLYAVRHPELKSQRTSSCKVPRLV